MNREDFIRDLTDTLQGEVTDYELNDSVAYYRDYINSEMAAGKTEEEVLGELGSPKLIGRSIIEARGIDELAAREGHSSYGGTGSEYSPREENDTGTSLTGIGNKIVTGLILVGVLMVVFAIARVLLPFVLVFALMMYILSLFRN